MVNPRGLPVSGLDVTKLADIVTPTVGGEATGVH